MYVPHSFPWKCSKLSSGFSPRMAVFTSVLGYCAFSSVWQHFAFWGKKGNAVLSFLLYLACPLLRPSWSPQRPLVRAGPEFRSCWAPCQPQSLPRNTTGLTLYFLKKGHTMPYHLYPGHRTEMSYLQGCCHHEKSNTSLSLPYNSLCVSCSF
jgi:hypothetical protein